MKLLIISEQYVPSTRSGSLLINDLIKEMSSRGHEITLITSTKNNKKEIYIKNLNIIRLYSISFNRENYILKGFNQILITVNLAIKLLFLKEKFDKIYIYSPPLFFGILSIFFKKQKKILNVQDIFPENAIDLGILKNNLLISFLKKIEKFVYSKNDYIIVNCSAAKKHLIKKFPQFKKKIIFHYNWNNLINKFKKKTKKNKIFKFIFGGSVGPSQDIQKVFSSFKKLEKICSLDIYTDHNSVNNLKNIIKYLNIKNIKIFKSIESLKFEKKIASYDSALITLNKNNKTPFIPGKFNFYCSNGINISAIIHQNCDLNYLIKKNKLGFVTFSNDEKKIFTFLQNIIKSKKHKLFNKNCLLFSKINFNVKNICSTIEKL